MRSTTSLIKARRQFFARRIARCLKAARAASKSGPDRETSRLAADRDMPVCPENKNRRELWEPLRAGTSRGPGSLMQPCRAAFDGQQICQEVKKGRDLVGTVFPL